jgi:hypothetical protein
MVRKGLRKSGGGCAEGRQPKVDSDSVRGPCRNPNKYLSFFAMLHPGRASLVDGGVAIARGRASSIRTRGIVQQLEALIAEKSSQRWSAGASMIDDASGDHPSPGVNAKALVATGWDAIDRALAPASPQCDTDALAKLARGGLSRGAIHGLAVEAKRENALRVEGGCHRTRC